MPLRNEHAARQLPPEMFVRFFRKFLARGVAAIMGVEASGRPRIQSVRFDKRVFTPEQARLWLFRNGFHTGLEEARPDGHAPHPP
ncbi:MAG TPA: hypothetical protein VLW85_05150 [Myxococcales bacterium]|nr:hypothetical protein [Myxococcales bacterium]